MDCTRFDVEAPNCSRRSCVMPGAGTWIVSVFLSLALVLFGQLLEAAPLSPEQSEALHEWLALNKGKGPLLTPPVGRVNVDVQKTRALIAQIIENLGGARLRAAGYNVVVNVYAGESPNAWVDVFPVHDYSDEGKWLKGHPGQVWPVRRLLKFDGNSKPIYEIGVTTGLFHAQETVDEVAAILSHELKHLFEGHVQRFHPDNDKEAFKAWWSQQANEAVADAGGVEQMIGKYDLDAAVSASARMVKYAGAPKLDSLLLEALLIADSSHHQEGVRLSLLQYLVQYYLHSDGRAEKRKQVELPEFTRRLKVGASGSMARDLSERVAKVLRVIDDFHLQGKPFDGYVESAPDASSGMPGQSWPLLEAFSELGGPDGAKIIARVAEHIEASGAPKTIQVNAFLQFHNHLLQSAGAPYGLAWNAMTRDDLFKIARLLVKGSSGADGWRYETLLSFLDERARGVFEVSFFAWKNTQTLFARLIQVSPEWRRYYQSLIDPTQFNGVEGEIDSFTLMTKLQGLRYVVDGPLATKYEQDVLQMISQLESRNLLKQEFEPGAPALLEVLRELLKKGAFEGNEGRRERIRQAFQPHRHVWQPYFFRNLERQLEDRQAQLSTKLNLINDTAEVLELNSLSPAEELRFRSALVRFATQADLFASFDMMALSGESRLEAGVVLLISRELASARRSSHEKARLFKFLAWAQSVAKAYQVEPYQTEIAENLKRYSSSLSKAEMLALVAGEVSSIAKALEAYRPKLARFDAEPRRRGESVGQRRMKVGFDGFEAFTLGSLLRASFASQANALRLLAWGGTELPGELRKVTYSELNRLMSDLETSLNRGRRIADDPASIKPGLHHESAKVLVDIFVNGMSEAPDLASWAQGYERVLRFAGAGFEFAPEQRARIEAYLQSALSKLEPAKRYQWLSKKSIRRMVSKRFSAEALVAYVERVATSDRVPRRADRGRLAQATARVMAEWKIQETDPELYMRFRNKLVESQNIQPHELELLFPEDLRSGTEKIAAFAGEIRGLSGLVGVTRGQPVVEQLRMIDYLMGRGSDVPSFVLKAERELEAFSTKGVSIVAVLRAVRAALEERLPIERSFIVNTFLVGPHGLLETPQGLALIKGRILQAVSTANRPLAQIMLESLFEAEGINKSLFISYVFAQKPSGSAGGLDETTVLKCLLDAFGVPTAKLAQYLAFIRQFEAFHNAFKSYQDAAMPINEYDALVLIRQRLGATWEPMRFRVVGIRGSGSANIAIEYEDLATGAREILKILRQDIEVKTKEDFRRSALLFEALARHPDQRGQLEFVKGLLGIIRRSVELEFDKAHEYRMQKAAQEVYDQVVDGWHIRTVDAIELMTGALRMEKAPGMSAVKVLEERPEEYRSALRAFYTVEYRLLRGVTQAGNPYPVRLFANPDLHDGQFLIDADNKTIKTFTLIDHGQSLDLSNVQRELGMDLLYVASGKASTDAAARLMEAWAKELTGRSLTLDREELARNLSSGNRMEIFVRVISQLSREGFELPLSSIHWVLGANRLIQLGAKIGIPAETSFRNLLLTRRAGLPLSVYNRAKDIYDRMQSFSQGPGANAAGLRCQAPFAP